MIFSDSRFLCKGMILVLLIGIVLRIVLGYTLEYNNDVTAWTMTIANIDGGNGIYEVAGFYYPPVWGYMLGSFAEVIEHLGVDSIGDFFTDILFMNEIQEEGSVSTPIFNLSVSMFLMIGDLLASFFIYWIVMHFTSDMIKAKIGFAFYFLGINVIVMSTMAGMFDTFSALITLMCVYFLLKRYHFLAGMMFTLAVMTKFFPVFLFFILVAYVIKKDRDEWKNRLLMTMLGAGAMLILLMLPQILNSNIEDAFSFITSRAEGGNGDFNALAMKYTALTIYPIILIMEMAIAYFFLKRDSDDVDRSFLQYLILSVIATFLYPSAPQYLILLTPFLILGVLIIERKIMLPLILLMIGSSFAQTAHISSELISITLYDHAISFETWKATYDLFFGPDNLIYHIWDNIGLFTQYIATLLAGHVTLKTLGLDIIGRIFKKSGPPLSE